MKDLYNDYFQSSSDLLSVWFADLRNMLLNFLLLLLYLVACWFIYKIVGRFVERILKISRIEKLNKMYEKMEMLNKIGIKIDFGKIIIQLIKLIVLLILVVIGADLFNFHAVTRIVNDLIAYLPRLISAIAIILAGFYISNRIKDWLKNMDTIFGNNSGFKIVSNIVVMGIVLFFLLMGLNQAGIDTTLVTDNISIILGVIFASIALSFGLGSKDIVKEILYSYYLRKSVEIGDKIRIDRDDVTGTLVSIDNINVKIATETGTILYPIKKFVTLKIEILD